MLFSIRNSQFAIRNSHLAFVTSIFIAALAVAYEPFEPYDPWDPQQRRKYERGRAAEQVVNTPGTLTRQGKYWVEEITGTIPALPRIRVESVQGGIDVQGRDGDQITYKIRKRVTAGSEESARRMLSEYPLLLRRRGEVLAISIESDRGEGIQSDFQLFVPRNTVMAELETRGGGIAVRDVGGHVRAGTAGGGIEADRIGGPLEIETAGGGIVIGTANDRVAAKTAGGNIKLGHAGGDAHVATAGGSVEVGRGERNVVASTAGGNISVGSAGGDVSAQTAGGSVSVGEATRVTAISAGGGIHVGGARSVVRAQTAGGSIKLANCSGPMRAETAAGSIVASIVTAREAWAESLLETNGGDIVVYIPANLALTIRAAIDRASRRHSISSDFPLNVRTATDAPGPREIVAEGAINGGGAALKLRTVSGNIEIKKSK